MMTVLSFWSCWTFSKISNSALASIADVGSSRIRRGASLKNARASASFCHWPPERSMPFSNILPTVCLYFLGSVCINPDAPDFSIASWSSLLVRFLLVLPK